MAKGIPEPAMTPIHPDKPEPAIVPGAVWVKIATGKTNVNAPQCCIARLDWTRRAPICIQFDCSSYVEWKTERVFRRDWRPL